MTQNAASPTNTVSRTGFANPIPLVGIKVTSSAFIKVYAGDEQLNGGEFTVDGIGDVNGIEVTIPDGGDPLFYPDTETFTVVFEPTIEQAADLSAGGLFGLAYEAAIDAIVRIIMSMRGAIDRTLKVPYGIEGDMVLPTPAAGAVIGWNDTADGFQNGPSISELSSLTGVEAGRALVYPLAGTAYEATGRRITDLADGEDVTDAATVGQLDDLDADLTADITALSAATSASLAGKLGYVTSIAALKALNTATTTVALLKAGGRSGIFEWRAGDYSKEIGFDTLNGVYAKADAVLATAGAWVRLYDEALNVKWWGALGDNATDDTAAIQAAVDFHDQNLWKADFNATTPSLLRTSPGYVLIPAGIFLINPTVGVRFWDKPDIRGAGTASSFVKAFNTSAGNLFYRYYNGTSSGNGRVQHVHICDIKGIVTGANQVIFNLEHVGRCEVHHVEGGTQDRRDEFNNLNQRYHAGSALFKIGVMDSVPNGYVNGSDVVHLHHFTAHFLDFGVRGSVSANMKQPEYLRIHDAEISDCHNIITLNASAGMIGYIGNIVGQRWGLEAINAATGLAGADAYGIDIVANVYKLENMYIEGNSTFAAVILRSGNQNIVDSSSCNRYGTTTVFLTDSATATVVR